MITTKEQIMKKREVLFREMNEMDKELDNMMFAINEKYIWELDDVDRCLHKIEYLSFRCVFNPTNNRNYEDNENIVERWINQKKDLVKIRKKLIEIKHDISHDHRVLNIVICVYTEMDYM